MGYLPSSFCYDCKVYHIKCGSWQRDFTYTQHKTKKTTSVNSSNSNSTNRDEHTQKSAATARAAHLNRKRQYLSVAY